MAKYQYGLYTEEQDSWLRENALASGGTVVTEQFNKTFNTKRSENALKMHFTYLKKYKKATANAECCQTCSRATKGGNCPMYKTCPAWRKWFKNEWHAIRVATKNKGMV